MNQKQKQKQHKVVPTKRIFTLKPQKQEKLRPTNTEVASTEVSPKSKDELVLYRVLWVNDLANWRHISIQTLFSTIFGKPYFFLYPSPFFFPFRWAYLSFNFPFPFPSIVLFNHLLFMCGKPPPVHLWQTPLQNSLFHLLAPSSTLQGRPSFILTHSLSTSSSTISQFPSFIHILCHLGIPHPAHPMSYLRLMNACTENANVCEGSFSISIYI